MPPKKKVAGDPGKGEKLFKSLCAVCHALGSHGTGPALKGVHGRESAKAEGFSYSGALSGKGGKWNDKTLDKWLKSPADYAPGKYLQQPIIQ